MGFLVNIHIMELKFFVNTFGYYDGEKRDKIESHFGLDKLFSQEQLEDFVKNLPELYKSYVLECIEDVYSVESGETVIHMSEKKTIIEQKATINFTDDCRQPISEKFTVTMDYTSLYDSLCDLV
jgi:hypothetical protein